MKVKIFCVSIYGMNAHTDDIPSMEKEIQEFLDNEVGEIISVTQSTVAEPSPGDATARKATIVISIFYLAR